MIENILSKMIENIRINNVRDPLSGLIFVSFNDFEKLTDEEKVVLKLKGVVIMKNYLSDFSKEQRTHIAVAERANKRIQRENKGITKEL